ncbi:HAD family hydrolase [Demequina aurantiaca]|uniref:HAD family hydrolase n=1 Tax=Demequina aurantiaca TaxID=676200 RepID=UPI0007823AB4|nr:HAD family hydrolase [Demequina aurantiaca]
MGSRAGATVHAVLFDVDDTLVDTKGAFRHALTTVAAEYLAADASLADVATFWRADRHGYYRAHTRGEMDHREQRMRRANDLHAEFGGALMSDAAYDAWDVVFEQGFQDGWRAFDDAHACLDSLDEAGIPYGALSNARFDYQSLKLATVGLERVPMLVGVDTLGFGKPDPRVFELAAERLGSVPSGTAYIGDELDIDAIAATRAGLSGYWLDRWGGTDARSDQGADGGKSEATQDGLTVPRVATLRKFSASIGAH